MKSKVLSKTQKALSDLSQIFLLISPSAIPSPHRLDLGHSRFFSPLYLNKKSLYLAQGLCPSCLPYWATLPSALHVTPSSLGLTVQFNVPFSARFSPTQPFCHLPLSLPHGSSYFQSIIPVWNHVIHLFVCFVYCLSSFTPPCALWEQGPWLSWVLLQSRV